MKLRGERKGGCKQQTEIEIEREGEELRTRALAPVSDDSLREAVGTEQKEQESRQENRRLNRKTT